jgi:hypothetical protein
LWSRIARKLRIWGCEGMPSASVKGCCVLEKEGHDVVIEGLVSADRAREIPGVDRGVEDSHRQQFAPGPIARGVVRDALERAVLVKGRDHPLCRLDERRERIVAKMINEAHRLDLFSPRTVQQQLIADVGPDDMIDQSAHIPLRTRGRSAPVVVPYKPQPPGELVVGCDEQLDGVPRRGHPGIIALSTGAVINAARG